MRLPRIIGIFGAAFGLLYGTAFGVGFPLSAGAPFDLDAVGRIGIRIAGALLVLLSYPVWKGTDWGRRLLVWVSLAMGTSLVLANWNVWRALSGVNQIKVFCVILASVLPMLFLATILRHPAVVGTFRGSNGTKRESS
jgi:hypothetical protein